MNIRMKVLVGSVKKIVDHEGKPTSEEIAMQAVYNDGGVNASWCKWTPYITFNFTVSNPKVFGEIKPGQFYYVDLVPTEKDAAF